MTLEEIEDLKTRIDKHLDILHAEDINAATISNAIAILISRDASHDLIKTWLKAVEDEINMIIETLEEIEESFS